jgi:YidC/Oxa1 family membrane protein insertase
MFDPNNFFNAFFVIPILNILIALYKLLLFVKIPGAFGFALILLTVLIRLILNPLMVTQLKSSYMLSKLKPELDKLNEKFKNDKTRLHQEQLKLYQQAGINPAAGCLPLLIQMPVLIALYNLFFQLLDNGNLGKVVEEVNKVVYFTFLKVSSLDTSFFGMSLGAKPSDWQTQGAWWLLLIPLITGLLQYWQTKTMIPKSQTTNNKEQTTDNKEEKKEEDMSSMMQKQMSIMMPLMIGFFAYSFPVGLSLYWNTFTVFGIIQQRQINNLLNKKQENGQK